MLYAEPNRYRYGFSNFELFLVDAGGRKEPVRVTTTDGFDGLPVFSPDGTIIAWTSNRTANEKSQIFLAEWNHEAAKRALSAAPRRGESESARSSGTSPGGAGHAPTETPRGVAEGGATAHRFVSEIDPADLRAQVSYLASDDVELAGQTIANIYDYTYALDAVRIGEPTEIIIVRDGQRMALIIVPEARK